MTESRMRTAGLDDLRSMLDWASDEGWNPGLDDAEPFLATDPEGFFVAEVDGAPVAAISVVNHADDFAFLGFYICRRAYRGRGTGYALWTRALGHAGSRTVGLDGVADQEANYAKSGFIRSGATVRHEGRCPARRSENVRDLGPEDVPALHEMDTTANGYPRRAFLDGWLTPTANRRTVVLSDGTVPVGFATVRRCREGAKIGPIVAPHADAALTLLEAAADRMPSDRLIVDVPSENTVFTDALRSRGFADTFATARMYRGLAPRGSGGLMAVATMELG